MDATQAICDSILESDDEGKEEKQSEEERLLAKLCILKNPHIPEAELPLTLGDNILGRDHNTCTVPLAAPSVSKQHATISISAYRRKGCRGEFDVEVLVWDLGSMNGTRKGHLKLTPHVRYALTEGDSLVVADIPCQYVSCSADSASSQNDTRTPESRKSKVKTTLHDAPGGKGGTSSTGNKDCVNGGANTRVSFGRTPVGDGEKEKGGHRKWTHLASDSDSHKLSFNSTTFLSPASRIVPESEDESSSTPSSSTAGRRDSRQQPETKRSPGILESFGTTFEDDKQNVMHDSSVEGEAEQPVSAPGLSKDAVPAFNMDSDVEEEVSSKEPQCSNENQEVGQPPNTDLFYIDSDTDVDEDQGAPAKGPATDSSFSDSSKPPLAASVIRPEGVNMDSDTDVDDAVSETAAATFQTTHTANSDFLAEARDFHLDSDTDVDEEEGCETNGKYSPPNIKLESAPHSLCVKTDPADKEAVFNSGVTETSACSAADEGTHLDRLSDSDTDVEETSAMASGAVTNPSSSKEPGTKAAPQSDSDADTDVDESSMSNAGKGVIPNDLGADSSDGKENPIPGLQRENTPGLQLPLLHNCSTPVQISAVASSAVRPFALSPCSDSQEDEDLEVAETQFFAFQTGDAQSSTSKTDERSSKGDSLQLGLSDSSHLQCQGTAGTMESTQAFVFTEGAPHLEDTQVYAAGAAAGRVYAGDESNMEATQVYGEEEEPVQCSEVPEKTDLAFEATQAYISDGDVGAALSNVAEAETQLVPFSVTETSLETTKLACSAREAAGNEKARRVENACPQEHLTEAPSIAETQPMCASEYEESEDELLLPGLLKRRETPHQTTPSYSSSLSLSETQPLAADDNLHMDLCDDHESGEGFRICAQTSEAQQQHADNDETHRLTNIEVSSTAETQLYSVNEDDDDDADSAPGLRRRKAKPLQFDESPAVETQPLGEHDGELSNEEDSTSCFRKQKAKPLQPEEESAQSLVSFQAAAIHSLSAGTELDQESDDEVSAPILRKRKAKQLHIEEEETQQLANYSETQSAATGEDGDEDFMPGLRRRKAKPLQIEDESQSLPVSEAAAVETQPMVMSEEAAWADQSSISAQRGGETKQLHVEDDQDDSEVKAPLTFVTCGDKVLDKEEIKSVLREKEVADVLLSPVRQTTMENQTPTGTTEERGRVNPSDCKTEEEENHAEQMRGRKTVRQEEDEDEEQLRKSAEQKKLQEDIDATGLRKEETEKEKRETGDMEREKTEKHQEEKKEETKDEGAERLKLEKDRQKPVEMAEVEPQDEIEKKDEEQEHQATTKRNKTNQEKESRDGAAELKVPPRGRRAARKTLTTNQDSTLSNNDDFPARRTRSRSNSSNSVCSDKSISSLVSQEGKGRGRGRGAKGSREAAAVGNRSSRRITAAARQTEQPHSSLDPSTSINYERSSVSSVNRGRGGRQRGKGRRTEPEPEITAPTMNKRSSRRSKAQESSRELLQEGDVDEAGAPPAGTSRGQQQANTSELEPAVLNHERQSEQEETILEKSPEPKRNVRGRGKKTAKTETLEKPGPPAITDVNEVRNKRKGQKSELEVNAEEQPPKVSKGNVEAKKTEICAGRGKDKIPEVIPAIDQVRRTGRASCPPVKKNAKEALLEGKGAEEVGVETSKRRAGGRRSATQGNKKEVLEDQTASENVGTSQPEPPQTPKSRPSRKRQASADSPTLAKTPRSSSGSPAIGERRRAGSQAYKVLFTGVVDEAGERVLARLGGSMAKGVADMNCLVTDKVRRTVKFLCALAKGVPVVTTEWLEKSGKAGTFLSPAPFLVKDPDQETKFSFSLEESLKAAGRQSLLEGYKIHVTKSVKPEPPHMKDIISSSGATFLPKMPTSHKPQTVVISCEEDWQLCGPAVSASLPIVTSEFILTGILQQKLDFQTHVLPPPAEGRGRRKT
uniref:Mediator of DNA damage checkpoint protein 1 n=1 Tax=Oryzias latipes TaxID=8090 RepID=A0A3P9J4S6_ORYLA